MPSAQVRYRLHIYKKRATKSQQNGYSASKRTLIADAKFDRILGEEEFHNIAQEHREKLKQETKRTVLDLLDDDDVELIWESPNEKIQFAAILECKGELGFISQIVSTFESAEVCLKHLESRVPSDCGLNIKRFSLLLHCAGTKNAFLAAAEVLATKQEVVKIKIAKDDPDPMAETPWFPNSVWELDHCAHIETKYEPELDERHPGFKDLDYRRRRKEIAEAAFGYRQGDAIPYVEYTEQEQKTWKSVYNMLKGLQVNCASERYIQNFKKLENASIFREDKIPQLQDVSNFLKKSTGFQLRPAAGLLSARDFLSSMAFRTFQCTQYVRHHECPQHTVEPDVIHELLGHVPMFVDPALAQFSQEIGLASLGATDEDIEHLATLYWFTVEFGLTKENGQLKAYGAGLLSAYGELKHALSGVPEYREFNPSQTAVQAYTDDNYQPLYFVTDSIENAMEKLRSFVAKDIKRPFSVLHNELLNKVDVIRGTDDVLPMIDDVQRRMDCMCKAIGSLRRLEAEEKALANGVA